MCIMCTAVGEQVYIHASVCLCRQPAVPQAEPVKKECNEMKHGSNYVLMIELKDQMLPLYELHLIFNDGHCAL